MSAVWEIQSIKGTEKLVLLSLADNANDNGICWPSLNTIARKCGVTRRQAIRIINDLEKLGFVEKQSRRKTEMLSDTNLYRVVTPVTLPSDMGDTRGSDMDVTGVVTPVSPKPSINHQLTINKEEIEIPEPTDFESMQIAIETLTGILIRPTQAEVQAINAMVTEGITVDNLRAAIAWFRDNDKVVRGAASLLNSARYNKAQQTQASVEAPSNGKYKGKQSLEDRNREVAAQVQKEIDNGTFSKY